MVNGRGAVVFTFGAHIMRHDLIVMLHLCNPQVVDFCMDGLFSY